MSVITPPSRHLRLACPALSSEAKPHTKVRISSNLRPTSQITSSVVRPPPPPPTRPPPVSQDPSPQLERAGRLVACGRYPSPLGEYSPAGPARHRFRRGAGASCNHRGPGRTPVPSAPGTAPRDGRGRHRPGPAANGPPTGSGPGG